MIYRRLGKSGLQLGVFSFGSWVTFGNQMDGSTAKECMAYAYDQGVNFFDNAEVYADGESEKLMGQALKDLEWGRDTYCVSSKVFWGGEKPTQIGLSKKHVVDACHAALKRLRVDYLDLYFCHRPDIHTPIEETVWAMNDLIRQGKVLYWGTSEWNAQQLTEAYAVAKENHLQGPTMDQPEYNLFRRSRVESELAPLIEKFGLGTTIWSPLASGLLTGKYNDGIPENSRMNVAGYEWLKARFQSDAGQEKIKKVRKFTAFARELGATPAHLALAWCVRNPQVSTVILGASKLEQLKENLKALAWVERLMESKNSDLLNQIDLIFENKPDAPDDYR